MLLIRCVVPNVIMQFVSFTQKAQIYDIYSFGSLMKLKITMRTTVVGGLKEQGLVLL